MNRNNLRGLYGVLTCTQTRLTLDIRTTHRFPTTSCLTSFLTTNCGPLRTQTHLCESSLLVNLRFLPDARPIQTLEADPHTTNRIRGQPTNQHIYNNIYCNIKFLTVKDVPRDATTMMNTNAFRNQCLSGQQAQ